jgi:hypothetical protein
LSARLGARPRISSASPAHTSMAHLMLVVAEVWPCCSRLPVDARAEDDLALPFKLLGFVMADGWARELHRVMKSNR